MSTTGFWYLIYGRIPKLIIHLPHYDLSNNLLVPSSIFSRLFNRAARKGWTALGSNPGGSEIFRTRLDLP
jgi:hypothetical protein